MPHVTEFRRSRLRPSLLLVALLFGLLLVPLARAATITVNTLADEDVSGNGTCSLREAMTAAANGASYHECPGDNAPSNTITFSVTGAIQLSLSDRLPTVEGTLEIAGPGISSLTITGQNAVGLFFVEGYLIVHDVSLTNGRYSQGAAIYINDGSALNVARVLFLGNTTDFDGGAIFDDDATTINITDSWFIDNTARRGGAIHMSDSGGTVTITNSMFDGNSAFAGSGGALDSFSAVDLSIVNCTFTENSASTSGGAIALLDHAASDGQINITHATFAGNTAGNLGGTLYGEVAGITIANSIVSGGFSCLGPITDGGYNIDDGATCGFGGTSLSLTNPQLDPTGRQPNGGPTTTVALQTTSPAVDMIPFATNGCATSVTTDQRGFTRPVNAGYGFYFGCDAGAFELQVDNLNVTSAKLNRESKPGRANGSVKVGGDFQKPFILTLGPPFSVQVEDTGVTDVSHTFTDCRDRAGHVKCGDVDGSKASFKPDRDDSSHYKFTASIPRLALTDAFTGPAIVTLTHNGVYLRRDFIYDCEQKKRGLDCREP